MSHNEMVTTIVMLVLGGAFVLTTVAYLAAATDGRTDLGDRVAPTSASSASLIARYASTASGRRIR